MATILIVEDDPLICELVGMLLQEWGYDTVLASDVDGALLLLCSPQQVDILFTETYLKADAFGGCQLARRAINLRPKLNVLYATVRPVTDETKAMFVEGAPVLLKPYTPNMLQVAIEALIVA